MESITGSGYITGKKSGIFAYLIAPTNTTIVVAGTYYPILGTFTNDPFQDFAAGTVYTPSIKYSGSLTQYFEIDWHATLKANNAATTVTFGIKKNGVLVASSIMSALCKTAGEEYPLSGTCVIELETDDEIQLVVSSDGAGDIITVEHYTTTISEFFD